MTRTIEITFDRAGNSTVETKGFQGHTCLKASHFLENLLGDTKTEVKTSDFYKTSAIHQSHQREENQNL